MRWYTDYRLLGLAILLIGSIGTNIAAILVAQGNKKTNKKIMTNDLVHIAQDVKELKEECKSTNSKIGDNANKLARIEGYLFGKAEDKK